MRSAKDTEEAAPKRSPLSRLLTILGIVLLVIALAIAGYIAWGYIDAQNRYSNIQSVSGLEIKELEVVDEDLQLEDLTFDWDALKALNPDVVGWIIIPGTNVNYPIVQGTDNSYYLYHLFDASSSGSGSVFVDYEGAGTLDGQNNLIYGHNMFDGSMFSNIIMYTSQDYFDAHRKVYLCTPELNYELSAVATIIVPENAELRRFSFEDQADFTAFVQEALASPTTAASDLSEAIAEPTALYSLVTCETFDASTRVILCAVPVRSVAPTNA